MNKLKCKICGGQIEMQGDDKGVCLNCGTAYSLESMKKMLDGVKVSMTGSSEDVEQWRQLLNRYYSAGDFSGVERINCMMLSKRNYLVPSVFGKVPLQMLDHCSYKEYVEYSCSSRK